MDNLRAVLPQEGHVVIELDHKRGCVCIANFSCSRLGMHRALLFWRHTTCVACTYVPLLHYVRKETQIFFLPKARITDDR